VLINSYKYILLAFLLTACSSERVAPVEELRPQYAMNHTNSNYIVRPGDTLYAIAFLYDENYAQLAQANRISYPYSVHTGQIIHLTRNKVRSTPSLKRVQAPPPIIQAKLNHWPTTFTKKSGWNWPTRGNLAASNSSNVIESKGINILGQAGQSVSAAKDGVVAYSGDGLPGYGNLILIKHDNDYLTAYAFNAKNLVKEGQMVYSGQKIATMGKLQSGQFGTHFEIRYRGSVLNPMKFLRGS
jgi:lipoprotein NlpD